MTVKERVIKLIVSLPDTPEAKLQLDDIEHKLEPDGNGDGNADEPVQHSDGDSDTSEPAKAKRLSFAAIGASGTADVSERFDEYLGLAIDRRHPRS
jgi:hypothetical protein